MEIENITGETVPGANQLGASEGQPAVGSQNSQEPVIRLSELKNVLGKDFTSTEAALKSVKDTYSYVGKVGQLEKELAQRTAGAANANSNDTVLKEIEALKNDLWFSKNPQYAASRSLIEKLGRAEGKPLHEVVEIPEFKETFTKVQGFDQSQKLRSVLESNPRLASSQDKMTKAQDLAATRSRKAMAQAGEMAVQAVIDATPGFE